MKRCGVYPRTEEEKMNGGPGETRTPGLLQSVTRGASPKSPQARIIPS